VIKSEVVVRISGRCIKVGNDSVVLVVLTEIILNSTLFWDVTPCSSAYFGLAFGLVLSSTLKIEL
jgi:hypothetical protein